MMQSAIALLGDTSVTSHQMSNLEASDAFDEMDVESDGGVSVDSVQIITEPSSVSFIPHTEKVKAVYHQSSVVEHDSSTYAWKLPVQPAGYAPKKIQKSSQHPIAKTYHRLCGLMLRNWKCGKHDIVPSDLCMQTPYSMSMVNELRRLSSITKQDIDLAHLLLLEAWNQRMLYQQMPPGVTVLLCESDGIGARQAGPFGKQCENKIQENVFGLKLEDVHRAMENRRGESRRRKTRELKTPKKIARQQKKLALQKSRSDSSPLSTAQRVVSSRMTERAARSVADQTFNIGDELVGVQIGSSVHRRRESEPASTVPPNSPVATSHRASGPAIESALREAGSRHNEQGGMLEHEEDALYNPSKEDREQDKQMSRVLGNIDMSASKGLRMRRMKKLAAGGLSRKNNRNMCMPSEKMKMDSLPSLHSLPSATTPDELARLGQLSLADAPSFSFPMRPPFPEQSP